jgi:hypothetical protein
MPEPEPQVPPAAEMSALRDAIGGSPPASWTHGDPAAQPAGSLWVSSRLGPDGRYACHISLGGSDQAWTFDEQRALRYARAVLRVAGAAEHDAAVLRELVALGVDAEAAAEWLAVDLRPRRRPFDHAGTRPLRFSPIVAVDGLRPIVQLSWPDPALPGDRAAQLDAAAAAQHALSVLEVAVAAELDDALLAMLQETLNLSRLRAQAVVDDLGRFRSQPE